ncbi:type VI secretion system Vgr family protein [Aporhodopirellula aestuarii]|uniref:Type VI secretion system tip protein VgrG n=1 Tax=Aporhodopirellula aestuarii TaxID=2950107 RepID=A0ABT0TZ42_9BACT|nr:type VI secretion system tip protein VgrG [Aporhodopirellula aestuarii]MCM2369871.1 type VI secretion system tip protein VgrG [Aporhodopirellula aestuarii]
MVKKERIHRIVSALGKSEDKDGLLLENLRYEDALGRPFECAIRAFSKDHSVDDSKYLGESLALHYEPIENKKRFIHGIVSEISYQGVHNEFSVYDIVLRPWLWFLNHTTDSRIFQAKTVPEIVSDIFKTTHGFTDFKLSLTKQHPKRNYCVQYRESDFDFVSRLLEEEGIYYYFVHEEKKHTMVLVDDSASHTTIKGMNPIPFRRPGEAPAEQKHISSWTFRSQLHSTSVTIGDYDFEKPEADITARANVTRRHKLAKFERYDFPGRYTEVGNGTQLAKVRAEEYQADHNRYMGVGNEVTLVTGSCFEMEDHPRTDQNRVEYLVTSSIVRIVSSEIQVFSGGANEFETHFEAMKKSDQFRSPSTTPRPIVSGPQSAVVVGKSGEEIWTDKYGRVKVQFPWDREGKNDENSSCWIRVSNTWAGKGWGSVHIPRIGQEVLVEFLDGDPDRPVITGRVYNAKQTTPYDLPDNQTQSGIKSRSTKGGKPKNFNELRFEDKADEEEIYLHAERDFTQIVENDATIKIGQDKKDKGNQTIEVFNDRTLTVEQGNETITVKSGNRDTVVEKGNESIEIKLGNRTIKVPVGKHVTQAGQVIELKVGASSIKIEPAKITISSPQVEIAAQAQVKIGGAIADVSGAATLKLSGAILKIN